MEYPIPDYPSGHRLYLLCWPDSLEWRIILNGLVTSPIRGRFWDATTGSIVDTQDFARENITLMDCNDLITALQAIASSVQAINVNCTPQVVCGSGSGGGGVTTPPSTSGGSTFGPPPPPFTQIDNPGGSLANTRKCGVATWLVDDMLEGLSSADNLFLDELIDLNLLALAGIVTVWLNGLIGSTILLGVTIAEVLHKFNLIVGYVYANAGGMDFGAAYAASVARRDDLICAFYEAQTADEAISDLETILGEQGVNAITRGFLSVIYDYSLINYLFAAGDEAIENKMFFLGYPGDCSNCEGICQHDFEDGILVEENGNVLDVQSTDEGVSGHVVTLQLNGPRDASCQEVRVLVSNLVGFTNWTGGGGVSSYALRVAGAWAFEEADVANQHPLECCTGISLRSDTPFTGTLTLDAAPC